MNGNLHIDANALMREIARYLAVVDGFREERCEPTWLAELAPGLVGVAGSSASCNPRKRASRRPGS